MKHIVYLFFCIPLIARSSNVSSIDELEALSAKVRKHTAHHGRQHVSGYKPKPTPAQQEKPVIKREGPKPFHIQFSIPETKIVKEIPQKDRDFATIIPGQQKTYIYTDEAIYYHDYQRSYFAVTKEKGGWDCMRHYEILANGCIPYFLNIDKCPPDTMYFLPKDLIKEAMHLEGVSYLKIDHSKFNKQKYYEILEKLLDYTRKYLTTRSMAQYILDTAGYSGKGTVLYLSDQPIPDYLRCVTLIGLKEILGPKVIDIPKVEHVYKSYMGDITRLYGKGFSYTRILDDILINRNNIEQRIKNKEFEIIIYGSIHRGRRYDDLVHQVYPPEKIFYLCGEDNHPCEYAYQLPNLFLREFY